MATLINGNGNLAIYAQQDADWYAALMGGQTVITAVGNQFAYELLASNTIGVKDGIIITSEGRRIQLDANAIDSFDIPTGAQGSTNYYIIGYHLVTGNQSEQTCETFVQLMENGTDTIPEGSFRDGDDEVFVSLYRVEQNDLTIGTITLLLPQLSGSFQSQITELNNDLTKKALVNTYYDSNVNKLYQINADGTRGGEINMGDVALNFATPVKTFTVSDSYTVVGNNKYLYVAYFLPESGNTSINIDGTPVAVSYRISGSSAPYNECLFKQKLSAGQVISTDSQFNSASKVYILETL